MEQNRPSKVKEVSIRGLVTPASWDGAGEVLTVSISAFDESEYHLADGELARQLFSKLHKVVSVSGELSETHGGKKMIKVQSYKVEKGPGAGKTLLIFAVAGLFGLVAISPASAAQVKAGTPAIKQEKADQPAVKAAAPVKTAKKTKAVKKQTSQAAKKKAIKANPQVKAAQSALVSAGYKIKADGVMGKNTKKALRAFQKKNKLKVTGKLDAATKKALAL
ncbi:MAG: peptidoglycan-binding domain-containing protein [Desulfarculaceae bacterium]|jgi:hypothetical protein